MGPVVGGGECHLQIFGWVCATGTLKCTPWSVGGQGAGFGIEKEIRQSKPAWFLVFHNDREPGSLDYNTLIQGSGEATYRLSSSPFFIYQTGFPTLIQLNFTVIK